MTDIEHNRLSNKYSQMTDENLLVEVIQNKNNLALDCLIDRYKDMVSIKANKFFMVG